MLTLREALKRKKVFDESGRWQAVNTGIRGWNIPSRYKDYFKIIKPSNLYPFLYSEV